MAKTPKKNDGLMQVAWFDSLSKHDFENGATLEEIRRALQLRDELLKTAKAAWEHVNELREAWRSGVLSEQAWCGGTRSNRNVDVEVALRNVIAKATP